jgi:putative DNA primase/helicase
MVISTNNLPPTDDKTDGFYRKWLIIEFPNTFQQEIDLLAQFTEQDYENLTARCLMALDNLLKNRAFSNEGDFAKRRERYEEKSNPFEKFWKEFVDDSDANANISKRDFATKLNSWIKEKRMRELSDVTISQLVRHKGFKDAVVKVDWFMAETGKMTGVRCWEGLKWK